MKSYFSSRILREIWIKWTQVTLYNKLQSICTVFSCKNCVKFVEKCKKIQKLIVRNMSHISILWSQFKSQIMQQRGQQPFLIRQLATSFMLSLYFFKSTRCLFCWFHSLISRFFIYFFIKKKLYEKWQVLCVSWPFFLRYWFTYTYTHVRRTYINFSN